MRTLVHLTRDGTAFSGNFLKKAHLRARMVDTSGKDCTSMSSYGTKLGSAKMWTPWESTELQGEGQLLEQTFLASYKVLKAG